MRLLLLLLCLTSAVTAMTEEAVMRAEDLELRASWIKMDKDLKAAVGKIVRKAMPTVMKEVYKKDLSSSCLSTLLQLTNGLKQGKIWAFQMLDASGRFPEGFLAGTLTSLGNYQECVRLNVNETKLKVRGQYCTVRLRPPIPRWRPFTSLHGAVPELRNISAPDTLVTYLAGLMHNLHMTKIKVGICTPQSCSIEDINKLLEIIPEKTGLNWKFGVEHCEVQQPLTFTNSQVAVLCVLGVFLILLVIGTFIDIWFSTEDMEQRSLKATLFHICKAFSFPANARKLSDFTCPQENLGFVYGLIFIVFYWVAISNTFMYVNYDVTSNFVKALEIVQEVFYEIVLNRVLPLQVLFFISGLVTTYRWLNSPEPVPSVWKFLLKRYWRFTPAYALVLALMIVTPTWGSGPSWASHMEPIYNNCKNNWWYNLLYFNNYMDSDTVCLDHTWIFAVDAQLHIMAVFILLPLKIRPKIGLLLTTLVAVTSLSAVALTNVYYDIPPNEMLAFIHYKDRFFYAEHSYYRMYSHVPLYCCGVLVAFFMTNYPKLKIPRWVCWSLWVGTTVGLGASFGVVHSWRSGVVPSPMVGALYTAFSKVAQGAFLSWLSVACMSGAARSVRDVLSWRPFAFLARLTFIAYLMHVPVIIMVQGFKKAHMFITDLELFYVVLNHVSGTFIIAYLLHLFFEAPFLSLGDILRRRCKRKTLDPEPPTNEEEKLGHKGSYKVKPQMDKSQC